MFKHAKSRVKRNGRLGYIFENLSSVLQGGVLSSTLIFTSLPLSYPSYTDCVNMGASGAESSKRDWDPWRWTIAVALETQALHYWMSQTPFSCHASCHWSIIFIPIFFSLKCHSRFDRKPFANHWKLKSWSSYAPYTSRKFPRVTCDLFTTTEWQCEATPDWITTNLQGTYDRKRIQQRSGHSWSKVPWPGVTYDLHII